jgi:3-isopropylmalate/(R)-2-methylmalate dehydratase large subunit
VLLYVDRTILNEYTSPQAFSGLREARRPVWRPDASLMVVDHVNPTKPDRDAAMPDAGGANQVRYFGENSRDFGIELLDVLHPLQGIEHVVAPELGFILPGMVVAAGDSHTTTYGALGALGFGIGTSDIEHYLATSTLRYRRMRTMRVTLGGTLAPGVTAKDVVMALIAAIGASGATGYAVEFAGAGFSALPVEGRMTVCNMAVECGARGVVMAPDQAVFDYLADKPRVPKGDLWDRAVRHWSTLGSDRDAVFGREVHLDASGIEPLVTWGISPDQAVPIGGRVPDPDVEPDMPIQRAFIGSCTNARLSDLREAAKVVRGRHVAAGVRGMVVPGSSSVRRAAEAEGLDRVFVEAGFEWRQSGCSLCLAMNDDVLEPGERCASSTNRNFEGRQGAGGRTHLMSPAMVAAAAITGRLTDVRRLARGD